MNCPYFRESYFGICVAPDSVHVPSIDEMERLCFRSSYVTCPNIASATDAGNTPTSDGIRISNYDPRHRHPGS
jgi:hypothetical protein